MQTLETYVIKRYEAIALLLGKPNRLWLPATFHQFRVEIKKLNAAFEMVKACEPEFRRKKNFRMLKDLFRQAGRVRELQVEELLMKEHFDLHPDTAYFRLLNKEKQTQRKVFFDLMVESNLVTLMKSKAKIMPVIAEIDVTLLQTFLNDKTHTIQSLLYHPAPAVEKMHELRKELKKYHYDLRSLKLADQSALMKASDQLMELLGSWHDKEICIQHMDKALQKAVFSEKEKKQLTALLTVFKAEAMHLYQQIKHTMVQTVLQETDGNSAQPTISSLA